MPEFEKSKKTMKIFMLVMGILQVISLVLILTGEFEVVSLIFGLVYIVLYFVGFLSAKQGTKMAGIAGIIMGCVLIATILIGDIIDCVVGIFLLIEAIKYNKLYKQMELGGVTIQTPVQQPVAPENPTQPVDNNQNNQTL